MVNGINMLTLEALKDMDRGKIFAQGWFVDSPDDIHRARTGKRLCWVAQRGEKHDWAIYGQPPFWDEELDEDDWSLEIISCHNLEKSQYLADPFKKTEAHGDKLIGEQNIRKLVPCTDEAFKMYRY